MRRLGGGYGGKLSYATPVAAGAALAAIKLNKPVRIVLDVEANMEMFGGRLPYLVEYKVRSCRISYAVYLMCQLPICQFNAYFLFNTY